MSEIEEGDHDLGHGVTGAWLVNNDGEVIGIIEEHDHTETIDGVTTTRRSAGSVPFSFGDVRWKVEAGKPGTWAGLTLSPSIACRTCPNHGWIQDGRWVPA